jgi:peptidoglycan/LPS O-acetylase OafA/YrhL
VYLVHQPVIVFTELALARTHMPLLLEFLLTIAAATALALGFYAVVRRNRVARVLFTGSSRPLPPTRGLFVRAGEPSLTRVAVE